MLNKIKTFWNKHKDTIISKLIGLLLSKMKPETIIVYLVDKGYVSTDEANNLKYMLDNRLMLLRIDSTKTGEIKVK